MVRAPCCEKMGLKRGPWTPEEDRILVAYIQSYGHENWRALPKQAGLLRCGKSCRLRWINYLKPDIKRGNFSKEEEEMIIQLHGLLGNRWSMIAARLPGRTDNEIKNVWHTHLKKRINPGQSVQDSKRRIKTDAKKYTESSAMVLQTSPSSAEQQQGSEDHSPGTVSPSQSYSDISSESNVTGLSKEECMDSAQEFPEIDESFWSEALSMDSTGLMNAIPSGSLSDGYQSFSSPDTEDMNFWLSVFLEAGGLQELPEI